MRKVDAANQTISTVAGNTQAAFSGDAGPAAAAALNGPSGIAIDSTGSVFVADTQNHRIRRVHASTRIITTVAGNGVAAYAGDNGPAIQASLNSPLKIAVDRAGNVFIADSLNMRVRKISVATGIITTIAGNGSYGFFSDGGPAAGAALSVPEGLVLTLQGDLLISDTQNQRLRAVRGPIR